MEKYFCKYELSIEMYEFKPFYTNNDETKSVHTSHQLNKDSSSCFLYFMLAQNIRVC